MAFVDDTVAIAIVAGIPPDWSERWGAKWGPIIGIAIFLTGAVI